jgi:hypothetical protein
VAVFFEYLHTFLVELVTFGLLVDLSVLTLEVALKINLSFSDKADINIGSRAEIVVDTTLNCGNNNSNSFFFSEIFFVLSFHNTHSCKWTRSEGQKGKCVHVSVIAALNKLRTLDIIATHNDMSSNMTSIVKDMGGKTASSHLDSVLWVGVQAMEFKFAFYHF